MHIVSSVALLIMCRVYGNYCVYNQVYLCICLPSATLYECLSTGYVCGWTEETQVYRTASALDQAPHAQNIVQLETAQITLVFMISWSL